jgi:hypothetical protein
VNRIRFAQFGGGDDPVDAQVAIHRLGGTNAEGLVGQFEVLRAAVGFAVDGDGFDPEFLAGADDAQCYFAPVGNQDTAEHVVGLIPGCRS